jgi:hypothetical protein
MEDAALNQSANHGKKLGLIYVEQSEQQSSNNKRTSLKSKQPNTTEVSEIEQSSKNYNNINNINSNNKEGIMSSNNRNPNQGIKSGVITVSEVNSKVPNANVAHSQVNKQPEKSEPTGKPEGESEQAPETKVVKKPVRVTSRIVFLKVGQIDTRNERYDAEAYIEASWEDDKIYKILADPNMTKNSKFLFFFKFFLSYVYLNLLVKIFLIRFK